VTDGLSAHKGKPLHGMRASTAAPFSSDALIRNVDVRDMTCVGMSDELGHATGHRRFVSAEHGTPSD